MKIQLTAEARVLLNAGTVVEVEPATAETIIRLGKAVPYAEKQATQEPEKAEEEAEKPATQKPEKAEEEAEKPATQKPEKAEGTEKSAKSKGTKKK